MVLTNPKNDNFYHFLVKYVNNNRCYRIYMLYLTMGMARPLSTVLPQRDSNVSLILTKVAHAGEYNFPVLFMSL